MLFQRRVFVLGLTALVAATLAAGPVPQAQAAGRRSARLAARGHTALDSAIVAGCDCIVGPQCCPPTRIIYRHRGACRVCCGCEAPIHAVLTVTDPCTCSAVEVPVCLPACCHGDPEVCSRSGLLASGIVTYEWCCGFSVTVRFKRCGDVVVVTHGA